jgi:hypothetical protein
MIKGDADQLNDLAARNVCVDHKDKALTVAWDQGGFYYLRCGAGHPAKVITRILSLTEEHKAGAELPEPVKSNVEKSLQRRRGPAPQGAMATTTSGVPATDLGTGALIPREKLEALVSYATGYGLDPRRGHVCLMYGDIYITLDGYLYHANRSGRLYSLESRPLEDQERHDYQIDEGDHAWISTLRFAGVGNYVTGIGVVTREEMEAISKKTPGQLRSPIVHDKPWQICQKRADWQALRRGFPIGESLPAEEE